MAKHSIRVGIVDDHPAIRSGLAYAARANATVAELPVVVVLETDTVDALLTDDRFAFDVVILDLSLADGSTPGQNVRRLLAQGYPVLVFTAGDNSELIRQALAAGASGACLKSEDLQHVLALARRVAAGETIGNQHLASAIASDAGFVEVQLSEQEATALRLYATGFTGSQVARRMNVAPATVDTYIKRVRKKYAEADRAAGTKVELLKRAVEDGIL